MEVIGSAGQGSLASMEVEEGVILLYIVKVIWMLQEEEVEVILRLLKVEVHILFKGLKLGQSHSEVS